MSDTPPDWEQMASDAAELGQMLQTDNCDLTEEGKERKRALKALLTPVITESQQ